MVAVRPGHVGGAVRLRREHLWAEEKEEQEAQEEAEQARPRHLACAHAV